MEGVNVREEVLSMRRLSAALVVAALPLVTAAPATAQQRAAVADGRTMLRLDRGTANVLQDAGGGR